MAYVRDDYGRIIAYRADEKGEKIPVRSICVGEERLLFIRTSRAQMMKTDFRYIIKTESRYGKKNAGLQEKAQARMERKKGWMKLM